MKKYEVLKYCKYDEIIEVMIMPHEKQMMLDVAKHFFNHKYDVPSSVMNAALIFGIIKAKESNNLPNIVYLRKIMETFEASGINTTSAAIKFLEDHKSFKNKALAEPDWMDAYVEKIAEMEV